MRALDAQRVENRAGVPYTGAQQVGTQLVWLVASALTAVIGEDQPELAAQCSGEAGRLRNLQRIREAAVKEDWRARASRVLEVRADAIQRIRRVGHRAVLRPEWLSTYTPTNPSFVKGGELTTIDQVGTAGLADAPRLRRSFKMTRAF
ncbi:MAG TPA: hypothetical protein VLD67_08655 [Vicinamibacterales bacterium]|nr:hypothetical protein [Vicinamibacterales bacterium]